jgi:hypothetical protein
MTKAVRTARNTPAWAELSDVRRYNVVVLTKTRNMLRSSFQMFSILSSDVLQCSTRVAQCSFVVAAGSGNEGRAARTPSDGVEMPASPSCAEGGPSGSTEYGGTQASLPERASCASLEGARGTDAPWCSSRRACKRAFSSGTLRRTDTSSGVIGRAGSGRAGPAAEDDEYAGGPCNLDVVPAEPRCEH